MPDIRSRPCPVCGKPPDARFRPFCSARCAQRDLGQWLSDGYAIPATELDEDGEEAAPPPRLPQDR